MNAKNLFYGLSCFLFTVVIGAAIYEHLSIWPNAFRAIPASLGMFQGEYPINAVAFWGKIHPVTLLCFIAAVVLNWKTPRRKHILLTFVGYFIILVITSIYFVPELLELTGSPFSTIPDMALTERGTAWENGSLARLAVIIGLDFYLFMGAYKPVD